MEDAEIRRRDTPDPVSLAVVFDTCLVTAKLLWQVTVPIGTAKPEVGHIDWEHDRITIQSPKTEHLAGGESRVIPLFPELRPYLEAIFFD